MKPNLEEKAPSDFSADLFFPLFPAVRSDSFEPVRMIGSMDRERFISELNLLRDVPLPTAKLVPGRSLLSHAMRKSSSISAQAQLRLYVDEWLETGRGENGEEDPRTRNLKRAPNALAAVRYFSTKCTFGFEAFEDGLAVRFPRAPETLDFSFDSPTERADRWFTLFLLCVLRLKLAKCKEESCGRYFELRHWNRLYKRGTFCPDCVRTRSLNSAKQATLEARKTAEKLLYSFASKRFRARLIKSPDWSHDASLQEKIIDYLNERIEVNQTLRSVYPRGVTRKWLSWSKNKHQITQLAKGDFSNAKG